MSETISKKLSEGGQNYKNLPELSYAAYVESERVNQENKNKKVSDDENTAIVEEDSNAVQYWLYAPGHGGEKWEEFYKQGIMAIGWGEIGDLSQFTDKNQIVYLQPGNKRTIADTIGRNYKAYDFSRRAKGMPLV